MKKKIVSLMLVGTMIFSTLAGCGQNEEKESVSAKESTTQASETTASKESESAEASTEQEKAAVSYPMEGNVKLTVGIKGNANISAVCAGVADTAFSKAWAEATGVEIEFVEVPAKDMNLLLTGADMPDIIACYNPYKDYPGGITAAIEDNIIVPITDYVEEYAPDYKAWLDSEPMSKNMWVGDEITGFAKGLESDFLSTGSGMVIRQDWLDELGLKVPTNADELYNVLKAFKEKKGAEVPLSTQSSYVFTQLAQNGMITSSFGLVNANYYVADDVIEAGFVQEEYRDVLEYLHKLYDEKLLDNNFAAVDKTIEMSNLTSGKSGMAVLAISSGVSPVMEAMKDDPNFKLSGVAPLQKPDGSVSYYTPYNWKSLTEGAFITSACDNIEAAVQFLNYGYTEEGKRLFNFGIEGVSWEMKDGVPTYTETVTNNPDMTKTQAVAYYARTLIGGPTIGMEEYLRQYNPGKTEQQCTEAWIQSEAKDHVIPTLVMTGDMATEFSTYKTDLDTYVKEMFVKFVNGTESLDNWDAYVEQCKKLKVDRIVEIYQHFWDEQMK